MHAVLDPFDRHLSILSPDLIRVPPPVFDPAIDAGQYTPIPSRGVRLFGPVVEILTVATGPDHCIDRTRSADHLPARPIAFTPAQRLNGLGREFPVERLVVVGFAVSDGHTHPRMQVAAPRLEDKNGCCTALAQPVGKRTTGRAGTNNDIVIFGRSAARFGHGRSPRVSGIPVDD